MNQLIQDWRDAALDRLDRTQEAIENVLEVGLEIRYFDYGRAQKHYTEPKRVRVTLERYGAHMLRFRTEDGQLIAVADVGLDGGLLIPFNSDTGEVPYER